MTQLNLTQLFSFVWESKYPSSAILFCLSLHILDALCLSIDWFPIKFSMSNLYQITQEAQPGYSYRVRILP